MATRAAASQLTDDERARALVRFQVLRPFLEDGVPLSQLAAHHGIALRTAQRWVGRFNRFGLAGLEEGARTGRPRVYSTHEVGVIMHTALTPPDQLGLPFGSWTLDRLVAYLAERKGITMKRSRISELLRDEGLRWRHQEGWFGERVDPDFAQKRGPLQPSTPPLQLRV